MTGLPGCHGEEEHCPMFSFPAWRRLLKGGQHSTWIGVVFVATFFWRPYTPIFFWEKGNDAWCDSKAQSKLNKF